MDRRRNDTRERILRFVQRNPYCSLRVISEHVGISVTNTHAHVKKLIEDGYLVRDKGKKCSLRAA